MLKPPKRLLTHRTEPSPAPPADRPQDGWSIMVPFQDHIKFQCEHALRALENAGINIHRMARCSAIDFGRNVLLTAALDQSRTSVMFIDSDIQFHPQDVINLFERPEPIVAGCYSPKTIGRMNADYMPEMETVSFGDQCKGLVPVLGVGAGFMRIHAHVLRTMIDKLSLPLCEYGGVRLYPFCMPLVESLSDGRSRYHPEDYAFCYRAREAGFDVLVDGSIRLGHLGEYSYGWEEMGTLVHPKLSGCTFPHTPSQDIGNTSASPERSSLTK